MGQAPPKGGAFSLRTALRARVKMTVPGQPPENGNGDYTAKQHNPLAVVTMDTPPVIGQSGKNVAAL